MPTLDGRAETVERNAATAPSRNPAATPADAESPATDAETAKPDWLEPYEALRRDWNSLIEKVQQTAGADILRQGVCGIDDAHAAAAG